MKKVSLLAAFAVSSLIIIGCANDPELLVGWVENNKISFSVNNNNGSDWTISTRSTVTTPSNFNSKVTNFRVWGYFSPSASADGATPGNLYLGESATTGTLINGNGSGTWTFANSAMEKFWPPTTAPLNFQAMTPASDASFTISNAVSNNLPHIEANVTVPIDNAAQRDIMFASATSQTQASNDGRVSLAFKHAMSAIRFSAKVSASTIMAEMGGVSLCNIRSTGKVGFLTDNSLGFSTNASPVAAYPLGMTSGKVLTTTATDITNADGVLIMLPQTTKAWSPSVPISSANTDTYVALSLKVAYNGVYRIGSSSTYQTVYLPFSAKWEQGKMYTYTLTVGTGTGVYDENGNTLETVPCSFTATSSEWTENNTGVFSPTPAERAPVDLGLPSGTLWAAGNVGAELPWETGLFFAWGETTGFSAGQVVAGEREFISDVYSSGSAASISINLSGSNDAAAVNLGGSWCMPSRDYYQELLDNCIYGFQSNYRGTGKACVVFTSMINGNELVIPCAGYYNGSSLSSESYFKCWTKSISTTSTAIEGCGSATSFTTSTSKRYYGLNVRAIIPGSRTPGSGYGTENGYDYVDLGLPSGLKWATCNVGATYPQNYGLYFAWGETTGYTASQATGGERVFDDATYKAGSAASISDNLTLEQDAARVSMGGSWRMPTIEEYQELIDNCSSFWVSSYMGKGIAGRLLTSKINGNPVFFPAAGYCGNSSVNSAMTSGGYLTSTLYDEKMSWCLQTSSRSIGKGYSYRCSGFSVRGVCE